MQSLTDNVDQWLRRGLFMPAVRVALRWSFILKLFLENRNSNIPKLILWSQYPCKAKIRQRCNNKRIHEHSRISLDIITLTFFSPVVFGPSLGLLGHPTSGCCHSRQCQGWAHIHGLSFSLDQSLIGYSYDLCVAFTPAHPIGQTDCKSKLMLLGIPVAPLVDLPDFRRCPVQAFLLGLLAGVIL